MFLSQRKNLNCFDSEKNKDDIVFYEYGAHFKYKNLYDCLNKLKINNSYENQKKKNSNYINYNKIDNGIDKSRNIQLNNYIRSINLYLKGKKNNNNDNKTLILPKPEKVKERINNHIGKMKKEKKDNKKNSNPKYKIKSTSHPKRTTFFNMSLHFKKEVKKLIDSYSKSTSLNHSSNKKYNNHNINTVNNKINKKLKFSSDKKKINSSSQGKLRRNQIKKILKNLDFMNDTSEILKSICLNRFDYLSIKEITKKKFQNNNFNKEKARSTKKLENNNFIKKDFLQTSMNNFKFNSRTVSPNINKSNNEKKNNSKQKNNFNKYDKILSKNYFVEKCLKHNKLKNSSIGYINTSINKTNISDIKNKITNPNISISLDNALKYKKINFSKNSKNTNNSNLDISSFLSSKKIILISPFNAVKKQIDEIKNKKKVYNKMNINKKEKKRLINKSGSLLNNYSSKNNNIKNNIKLIKKEESYLLNQFKKEYHEKLYSKLRSFEKK